MTARLVLVVLLLACEGTRRERTPPPEPSAFATPSGRLDYYRLCAAERWREPCGCAELASGERDYYRPGRMTPNPDTQRWLEREVGISCGGRDAGW